MVEMYNVVFLILRQRLAFARWKLPLLQELEFWGKHTKGAALEVENQFGAQLGRWKGGKRSTLTPSFFSSWDHWDCQPHQNFSHHQDLDSTQELKPCSWYHLDGKKMFLKLCCVIVYPVHFIYTDNFQQKCFPKGWLFYLNFVQISMPHIPPTK